MQNAAAQTPSAIAAKEKKSATAREQLAKRNALDIGKDGLMQAIAKLGGINAEAARKEFGIDPADMKLHGDGILRSFTKAGKQLDTMRELLLEQGYPVGESVRDFGDAIGEAMSGNDIMTPEGMEALAQKNFEEYSAKENGLSKTEQAQLDKLVTWATNKFGADVMAETDAALASAMKGESPAQIERALIRTLQEEYDNDQSNEGTQQAAEGQARLDNQSGSEEGGGKRNDGISEESNGSTGTREDKNLNAREIETLSIAKEANRLASEANAIARLEAAAAARSARYAMYAAFIAAIGAVIATKSEIYALIFK